MSDRSEESDEPEETIRERTAACKHLIEQCLCLKHFDNLAWFEMRRGDFNLWVYGLQALGTGKSSLDYRVRNRRDVRDIILALLRGLSQDLKDCIDIGESFQGHSKSARKTNQGFQDKKLSSPTTQHISTSETSEQDDVEFDFIGFSDDETGSESEGSRSKAGPFALQVHNIRTIFAQLTRFSSMIRRSGTKFRFQKADSALALNESRFLDFKEHLVNMVLLRGMKFDAANQISLEVFQAQMDPNLLTPVQHRLIHGNILRRNRILEATKRMKSGVTMTSRTVEKKPLHLPTSNASTTDRPATVLIRDTKARSNADVSFKSSAQSTAESTAKSATEIGSQLGLQVAPPKEAPSIMTKVTRTGTTQDYPRCPKPVSDDFIVCPYCADMLTVAYKYDNARWRYLIATSQNQKCPFN